MLQSGVRLNTKFVKRRLIQVLLVRYKKTSALVYLEITPDPYYLYCDTYYRYKTFSCPHVLSLFKQYSQIYFGCFSAKPPNTNGSKYNENEYNCKLNYVVENEI